MGKKETILEAFLRQTKIDDESADQRDKIKQDNWNNYIKGIELRLAKATPSCIDKTNLNIPTKMPTIKESTKISETKESQQFKDYDHDLDIIRDWRKED